MREECWINQLFKFSSLASTSKEEVAHFGLSFSDGQCHGSCSCFRETIRNKDAFGHMRNKGHWNISPWSSSLMMSGSKPTSELSSLEPTVGSSLSTDVSMVVLLPFCMVCLICAALYSISVDFKCALWINVTWLLDPQSRRVISSCLISWYKSAFLNSWTFSKFSKWTTLPKTPDEHHSKALAGHL